jgi:hypothetical protein
VTRPALIAAAAALGALSCAHNPELRLENVLRLEQRIASQPPRAAAPFEVQFSLRNVGAAPVVFCQMDSGVSIALRRPRDPDPHPIVLHGLAMNAPDRCYERITLEPGAAKEFRETLSVREDLAGPAYLLAQIRIHLPDTLLRRETDAPTIRARALPIVIQRAAQAKKAGQ